MVQPRPCHSLVALSKGVFVSRSITEEFWPGLGFADGTELHGAHGEFAGSGTPTAFVWF